MKTFLTTLLALAALFTSLEAQTLSNEGAAGSSLTTQDQNISLNNALFVVSQPITFEGWPDGTVLTTQYPNVDFNGAVVLTAASAGGSLLDSVYPPHSGTNVIYDPNGPLTLTFSSPVEFVNGYFTYAYGLTMTAYDSSNNVLATAQQANPSIPYNTLDPSDPTGPTPNELIGITLTTPSISTVVISNALDPNLYGYITADDISFTGSVNLNPVPEPSSLILMGAAFLVGGCRYGVRGIRARRRLTS
jgi:hypothetical protein